MAAKTLVVIMGETRAHELTFPHFKKNVIQQLDADLALCIGDNHRETPNEFYSLAKHIWKFKETGDWEAAFDKFAPDVNWRALVEVNDYWFGVIADPNRPYTGTGCINIFFREFLRRKISGTAVLDQYDWIILTRSDYMWFTPHPPLHLFSPQHIYLPDGEHYRGYVDRHALVPRALFDRFMEVPRAVFEEPEKLAARMKAKGAAEWNNESFLYFRLGELGLHDRIRFFPYMMFTVRALGAPTAPGLPGMDDPEHHLHVKYPLEYYSARAIGAVIGEDRDWNHMIGVSRLLCWRYYLFLLLRVLGEKHKYARRFRSLRLARRFVLYALQIR